MIKSEMGIRPFKWIFFFTFTSLLFFCTNTEEGTIPYAIFKVLPIGILIGFAQTGKHFASRRWKQIHFEYLQYGLICSFLGDISLAFDYFIGGIICFSGAQFYYHRYFCHHRSNSKKIFPCLTVVGGCLFVFRDEPFFYFSDKKCKLIFFAVPMSLLWKNMKQWINHRYQNTKPSYLRLEIILYLIFIGGCLFFIENEQFSPFSEKKCMLIYFPLLILMLWKSIEQWVNHKYQNTKCWSLCGVIGGILFCISDGIIAANKLIESTACLEVFIMPTYYIAQCGIALSAIKYL